MYDFDELCWYIDRWASRLRGLPHWVDRQDVAQQARLVAWAATRGGVRPALLDRVLDDALRQVCGHDAGTRGLDDPIRRASTRREADPPDSPVATVSLSVAGREVAAHATSAAAEAEYREELARAILARRKARSRGGSVARGQGRRPWPADPGP